MALVQLETAAVRKDDGEDTWIVHINEGFVTEVKSANVEGALMQAFAKYWEKSPDASSLTFEISVVNKTLYNRLKGQSEEKALDDGKG